MQAQQRKRGHGISRRRWRILQRLAAGREHAETLALGSRLSIEEPSRSRIEKPGNHGIGNSLCELEITKVGGSLVSVKASNRSGSRSEEHTSELQSLRHLVC